MIDRLLITIAGIHGALGIALSAFGAHMLKSKLDAYHLDIYNTGTKYHMITSVVLLILALSIKPAISYQNMTLKRSFYMLLAGQVMFSGSLFLLCMQLGYNKIIGPVTPIGGIVMILAWLNLLFLRKRL